MSLLTNDIEITISIGASSSVSIRYDRNEKKILAGMSGASVDENIIALSDVICHCLRAMSKEITLDRYFNPYSDYNSAAPAESESMDSTLFAKVEWTRAGYLKRRGWIVRPFKHAETVSEALQRSGVFSCPQALVSMLPIKKPDSTEPNDLEDNTGEPDDQYDQSE